VNNLSKTLIALLIISCAVFLTTTASAYVYINASSCPNGSSWGSSNQPLSYYINENGSADVSMSQLQTLTQDSFDEWGTPCCSTFSTTYQGTTTDTARQNNGKVVLSWEENSWPTQMGNVNQTIAVTMTSVYNTCEIASAPILFNGVGFQFCTSGSGCTDLQSIATHEIGHNLGLGHSQHSDATMYYAYQGGSGARSLSQDDVNGVCSLYTGSCNCSTNSDCGANQVCNGSQCEDAPCQSDNDCPGGQECASSGDCEVPSCGSDADCADGYTCDSAGKCTSSCPVCRTCTTQEDCGANGFCTDVGGQNKCITTCGTNGSCPGDSTCYRYDDYYVCLNPDANTVGVCPSSYTCTEATDGDDNPCTGLGNTCDPSTQDFSQCSTDNDACLTMSDGNSICTCMGCTDDADCGDNGLCTTVSNGQKACVADGDTTDPCDGVSCNAGEVCDNGQCVDEGSSSGEDTGGSSGDDTGTNNTDAGSGSDDDAGSSSADGGGVGGVDGDGGVKVTRGSGGSSSGGSSLICSSTAPGGAAPGALMLFGVFGLGLLWRRTRR
jgi:MYXO-CTERM domain-containing protein